MKKLLLMLFLIGMVGIAQAQTLFTKNDLYEDPTSLLLKRIIIEVDSTSSKDLQTLVKNWSGMTFRNATKVIVSETNTQMVLRYHTDAFYKKALGIPYPFGWYVRLQIEFKDNKVRISAYDDGNAYVPPTYSQYGSSRAIPEGKYNLIIFGMKKDGTARSGNVDGYLSFKKSYISTLKSLEQYLFQKNLSILQSESNW